MKRILSGVAIGLAASVAAASEPPAEATRLAERAVDAYADAQVELLADLVEFRTYHREGVPNAEHPEYRRFAEFVGAKAAEFGLDFTDMGAVLVVSLGDSEDRLGIVTHGDVQPADADKWAKSPFTLDTTSEPGRLIARGTEDDKAPIATAMYAMKTIREAGIELDRRIELIISLTEEHDWAPFRKILETWEPPAVNIAIDSVYPVAVAEKGWGALWIRFDRTGRASGDGPVVRRFEGGAFISQVPEDAVLEVTGVDDGLVERIRKRASAFEPEVAVTLRREGNELAIDVKGRSAHSMQPSEGINALAHAAALLEGEELADTAAARAVDFVNELIGLGVHGEQFGDAAYRHDFMGPLTVNLSTVTVKEDLLEVAVNTRAPAGKSAERLEADMRTAVREWASSNEYDRPAVKASLSDAYLPERPPQVDELLAVYRHYTGDEDAEPVSLAGGTNARLLPNGVNFGPSMPGVLYTGHSEHEFITREQMTLNLRMYTAMMTWLAARPSSVGGQRGWF